MPTECAHTGPTYAEQPDLAIAALLAMLSRHHQVHCDRLTESILAHLRYVGCDERYSPPIREVAIRIYNEWRLMKFATTHASATGSLSSIN